MVKNNYQAWHIRASEFAEEWSDSKKLQFFAKYAILAPSGHNTQPWHFISDGQTLILKADPARHLPYSGTKAAEPFISLGCCLAAMDLAANGFGYRLQITYKNKGDSAATIKISDRTTPDSSLLKAIVHRTSNRNSYHTEGLPTEILQNIVKTNLRDVDTHIISTKIDIDFVAQQTAAATIKIMSDPKFRLELSKWVRNNATRKYDGMPAFAQGMPMPPSLIAKHVVKNIDVSKVQAKKDAQRVTHSADLVILMIKNQNQAAFLDAGRLYAHICILAQQQGISTSGVGASVIDPEIRQTIKDHFKLPYQPVAIIRLGKSDKDARHTPRWPLSKVIN